MEFSLITTRFTQPPCYYSQFIVGQNLKNLFNMATLLIWSDFCGPLATGLTEFHCNWLFLKYLYLIFVPHRDENEFELLPTKQNSLLHILGVNYVIYKKPQLSIW